MPYDGIERRGTGDQRFHRGGALVRPGAGDQGIRVLAGGQGDEAQAAFRRQQRQGAFRRARLGPLAGGVAVETQIGLVGDLPQQGEMAFRQRRAERRDRLHDARLGQGDHVHIAFGDQDAAPVMRRGAGLGQAVQGAALVEQRRVGGIEVFGLAVAQGAAAERDDAAAGVGDREQHPVAEKIVGRAAVIGPAHQPALGEQRFGHGVGHDRGLDRVARRREAEAEPRDRLVAQPAPVEIVERGAPRRQAQGLFVIGAGGFHHLQQPGPALRLDTFLRRRHRHLKPRLRRQPLHRLGKRNPLHPHQIPNHIPMCTAAETVVEVLII